MLLKRFSRRIRAAAYFHLPRKRSPSSTAEGSKAEQKTKMKQVERKMRYLDLAKAIAGINITGHSDLANPGGASREMSSGGRSCRRPGMQ
ncbi:hypothetical protein MUK42_03062 [Musa troglodytarum]|uniref:Uncharacterized protein n=1 Tax=Musa troglodytarum TaxID=320322 RepID=A0A9E7K0V3_9LILI|nr:hypothetical protein MUK42_03062 [Musa troglodytarum]